jgi:hypothetical protein
MTLRSIGDRIYPTISRGISIRRAHHIGAYNLTDSRAIRTIMVQNDDLRRDRSDPSRIDRPAGGRSGDPLLSVGLYPNTPTYCRVICDKANNPTDSRVIPATLAALGMSHLGRYVSI